MISTLAARIPIFRARLRPLRGERQYCTSWRAATDFVSDEFGALSITKVAKSGSSICANRWRHRSKSTGRLWVQITTATVGVDFSLPPLVVTASSFIDMALDL